MYILYHRASHQRRKNGRKKKEKEKPFHLLSLGGHQVRSKYDYEFVGDGCDYDVIYACTPSVDSRKAAVPHRMRREKWRQWRRGGDGRCGAWRPAVNIETRLVLRACFPRKYTHAL